MKSHGIETSSRTKELQPAVVGSSAAIVLPNITALMRNEFLPLMQCLEQSDDILCRTYTVELALTLARLDASLKEEERRIFVCAFDSLSRHLLKDLHHFMEVEGLLQQDLQLLMELAERCRMVELLYTSRSRGSGEGLGLTEMSNVMSCRSSASVAMDVKGQRGTSCLAETCGVNGLTAELQQLFLGSVPGQMHSASPTRISRTPSISGNNNEVAANVTSRSKIPPQRIFQQPSPSLTTPLCDITAWHSVWCPEEFCEFLAGRLTKSDVSALLKILHPANSSCGKCQRCSNVNEEEASKVAAKAPSNTSTCGKNANSNPNNDISTGTRLGAHAQSAESALPRRSVQSVDDVDSCTRVSDGLKAENPAASSSSFVFNTGGRVVNRTALHINIMVEGLLYGGPSAAPSLNSSFSSVEEAEQSSAATDAAAEHSRSMGLQLSYTAGRHIALPSPAAIGLLTTLFPCLRNYAEDFKKIAENAKEESGSGGNAVLPASSDTIRRPHSSLHRMKTPVSCSVLAEVNGDAMQMAAPDPLSADFSGHVRPIDVVLFCFLRSLINMKSNISSDVASVARADDTDQSTARKSSSEDAAAAFQKEPPDNAMMNLPGRMAAELEVMIKQVQESMASTQALQEQIREEVALLVFRAITITVDLLIPAVQCADRRVMMFYRKWICDLYRLLWEEDLLERFSGLVEVNIPQTYIDNTLIGNFFLPRGMQATPQCSTSCGRHLSGREGSAVSASKQQHNSTSEQNDYGVILEDGDEEQKCSTLACIAPGNAYSRSARSPVVGSCTTASLNATVTAHPSLFLSTTAAANECHHGFGLFDDPAVLVAESLLEDTSTETPPPCSFVVTRLMAALLRGLDTDRLRHLAPVPDRSPHSSAGFTPSTDQPLSGVRKTPLSVRTVKKSTRKKIVPSPQRSSPPLPVKVYSPSLEEKPAGSPQRTRFRYPAVTTADDVKALYCNALLEAEIALSPLDPIRAALVQNAVDYLVSAMHNPKEAYELLDAYLDDVGTEQIQPPATGRAALDGTMDNNCGSSGGGGGGSHSLSVPDSPFSVTTVRRVRPMPSDMTLGGGDKIHAHHTSHTTHVKRSAGVEKDNNSAASMRLPLIPKVIPSWNSTEEQEQFLVILALLRREYITLSASPGAVSLDSKMEAEDSVVK
ncbi:hypothetical protein DQ04_00161110 [Trypanosoma grayi]|uniref:hypothetical protein n=1 Tax=Trypanosoma grayi TaxID=71804 RepID=UPI0004F401FD|nr:hypothetical protein DQ04_00161110 [Trypanosoma grayi]KEG15171.1 hypothetical protein DQ04_00161110 [Trypanosoma grayi]